MDPIQPDETIDSGESFNPYATPSDIGTEPDAKAFLNQSRIVSAPWTGGWKLATLIVMGMSLMTMMVGSALAYAAPVTGVLGGPLFALVATAVIVRSLHNRVSIDWVTYGLASVGFGVASLVCFIPVCIVVTIPTMALMDTFRTPGLSQVMIFVAIFISITLCGMFFVALLRLYFNSKYRSQAFRESLESQTFGADSLQPGIDPWRIQAARKPRASLQAPPTSPDPPLKQSTESAPDTNASSASEPDSHDEKLN